MLSLNPWESGPRQVDVASDFALNACSDSVDTSLNPWESGPRQVDVASDFALDACSDSADGSKGNPMRETRDQFFFFLFPTAGKLPNSDCQNQTLLKSIAVCLGWSQRAAQQRQIAAVECALLWVLLE
ncbi:hypothetical protein HGM15179_007259 [Zosterops borbonicus]|uniref:Uncharacterized protein n=1 Tax=Zosterops borbonicus TaxID=364589 RepID=A0A8K1LN19_9PASS|nr:hypothetical protein HGM15179_007259 [Zosterops borbonicus]